MFLSDPRNPHKGRRARRRTPLAAPERLESRDLMAYNPLGFSIPDLTISGTAARRVAWGGQISVDATVVNQGSSTITNPIAQAPGDTTTADAPASTVAVVITPHRGWAHAVTIGTFQAPPVSQNSLEQMAENFTLPSRPAGFAKDSGTFYVHLIVNSTGTVLESDRENDFSKPIKVHVIDQALPEIQATALNIAAEPQPGDTIYPQITVTNVGTAPTTGPVEVALVASTTKSFTAGSSIVALYSINSLIPSASQVATGGLISAFAQTTTLSDSITFTGPAVTLPTSPRKYYLGVVVDPYGQLTQLNGSSGALQQVITVGPATSGLSASGVVSTGNPNPFPLPASGTYIGINPTSVSSSSTIT